MEVKQGNIATLYRPSTFAEVVGQDVAVAALKRIAMADGITVRSIFLKGSWGSGKCVSEDTIIRTDQGLRRAADLKGESFKILGRPNGIVHVAENGIRDCLRITTDRGVVVTLTSNHPVFIWNGMQFTFKTAGELQVGDCVISDVTEQKQEEFCEFEYLIGLFLGDGVLTTKSSNSIEFLTTDIELAEYVERFLSRTYCYYTRSLIKAEGKADQHRFTLNKYCWVYLKFKELGLLGHDAKTKCLPTGYWNWSFSQQVSLVQGLMDTDGAINADGSAELGLSSYKLLFDVKDVIQSMGFGTRLVERKRNDTGRSSWRLFIERIRQGQSCRPLVNLPRKLKNCLPVRDITQSKKYRFLGMANNIIKFVEENKIKVPNADRKMLNMNKCDNYSISACLKWQKYLQGRGYEVEFLPEDIIPDFVKSIEVVHHVRTIDIQCKGEPVFYTQGIITHNTTLSKIFGKALNCTEFKKTGDVCGECSKCKEVQAKNSQLYYEFDSSVVGNVDAIRGLYDKLAFAPQGRRLVVFDECQSASNAAMNALLKMVEEGVPNTIFLFLSTEDILNTIKSRSLCIDIGTIPLNLIKDRVKVVMQDRGLTMTEDQLDLLAIKSKGHMRDALSILQFYELCGDKALESSYNLVKSFIVKSLSNTQRAEAADLIHEIVRFNVADIRNSIQNFIKSCFLASEGTVEHTLCKKGLATNLMNYFYSPIAVQAMKDEVGMEILLRAFYERLSKPKVQG